MAVGNNNGAYGVPEGLRSAVEAPGFAYVMRGLHNWNGPRREELDHERDQRSEAKRAVEKGLDDIRIALANPNLTDTERSKLQTEQTNLQGLQTQLSTGFGGVNVQGILATATAAATSASTMASGLAAGSSTNYVAGSVAAQIHSSQQMVALQNRLYNSDPIYREESNRIAAEAAQGREAVKGIAERTGQLSRELGIDTRASDQKLQEIERQRKEAAEKGDRLGERRAEVMAAEEVAKRAHDAEERAQTHGSQEQQHRASAERRHADEEQRNAQRRLQEQQRVHERSIKRNPNLTLEKQQEMVRAGHNEQRRETAEAGNAKLTHNAANANEFAASAVSIDAASLAVQPIDDVAGFGFEDPVALAAEPTKKVQQVASMEAARDAAKPLAQNGSQAAETTQEQTEAPRTQVAQAATAAPSRA